MKVGFAVSDITPELGIYLTGYGRPERLADGVHSPLFASAMYLAGDGTECAVVSLDWCFIGDEITDHIRAAITAATQIPENHILEAGINTLVVLAVIHINSSIDQLGQEMSKTQRKYTLWHTLSQPS